MPSPQHVHVLLVGGLLALLPTTALGQSFRYVQLDVGQGDAAVVIAPSGCAALFDGGPKGSGAVIKSWLKSAGIQRLDFAVASHYDADHIGGLDEVATGTDAVTIDQVYDHGGSHSTVTFTEYATVYANQRRTPTVGQTLSLCPEVTVRFVAVNGNGLSGVSENGRSVAAKVSFGTLDVLLGGDLDEQVESLIRYDVGPVEVYKVDHHGSATSSADDFLYVLRPLVSFISVGVGNSYGHPTASALDRLRAYGSDVWQTEDPAAGVARGHLLLTSSDGRAFTVSQAGVSKSYGTPTPPSGPGPVDPGVPGVVTGCSQAGGGLVPLALLFAALPFIARRRAA